MVPKTCVAAIAALFLAVAPSAGATASGQASCQGAVTSDQASSGLYKNAIVAGEVHELGGEAWADLQQGFAHRQPCN
jgi:hypothetical protein